MNLRPGTIMQTFSGSYFALFRACAVFAGESPPQNRGGWQLGMTPAQIWNDQTESWWCILMNQEVSTYFLILGGSVWG